MPRRTTCLFSAHQEKFVSFYHGPCAHRSRVQTLKPRYTCAGFDIMPSKKESNTTFIRAIRAMTLQLPSLIVTMHDIVSQEASATIAQSSEISDEGFKAISLTELIDTIQIRFNMLLYLGDNFCSSVQLILAWHS